MSIFCKLGFHSYVDSMVHMNWRMSTDESIEWSKRHFGWHEFRECKRCGDMQQREIRTSYGRILYKTEWGKMDKESSRVLEMYKFFNKKN
jgi:hypothetical protein